MRHSEIAGGQEGTGIPVEIPQGTQRTNELFTASTPGLVPTVNQGARDAVRPGIGRPLQVIGEVRKEREPEDKLTLARAMAKRIMEEKQLDLQAMYGTEQPAPNVIDQGIERSRAFIALETLNFYDDPYDIREIADTSVTEEDLRERSEFAILDDVDLWTQAAIMRNEVGLRLVEIRSDVRGPEIDIYRRLRIKADEVLEDKQDRQVIDVFADPDLYRQTFTSLYANVGEFIAEQQRFIRDKDYAGIIIRMEAQDPNLAVRDIDEAAGAYALIDYAMIVARARRMWGDDAFEALSADVRSQLPNIPLGNKYSHNL